MDEMRAQTAASLPKKSHTSSTVTINLPHDFSFLKSPRDAAADSGGEDDEEGFSKSNNFYTTGAGAGVDGDTAGGGRSGLRSDFQFHNTPRKARFDDFKTDDIEDPFRTAQSNMFNSGSNRDNYPSARSVSQDEEMFDRYVPNVNYSNAESADGNKHAYLARPQQSNNSFNSAKECDEDDSCMTARSTVPNYKL